MNNEIKGIESSDILSDEALYFDDVSITYCQNDDCTTDRETVQTLRIETRNNGVARFVNIKTGKEGWSISDYTELYSIFKDFWKRAELPEPDSAEETH